MEYICFFFFRYCAAGDELWDHSFSLLLPESNLGIHGTVGEGKKKTSTPLKTCIGKPHISVVAHAYPNVDEFDYQVHHHFHSL